MSKNKLRNGLMVAAAVGAGASVYTETRPSVNDRVSEAQQQIVKEAQKDSAHPVRVNYETGQGSMAAYEAPIIAQEAKAVREAKELTAKRIAKLSFSKAFNEATDIGMLISDVSDRTSIPAQEVLNLTLPKSSVTALEARNVHFIYNSSECNPFVQDDGNTQVGYIPLTVSDAPAPEITHVTYVNSGETTDSQVEFEPSSDSQVRAFLEEPNKH